MILARKRSAFTMACLQAKFLPSTSTQHILHHSQQKRNLTQKSNSFGQHNKAFYIESCSDRAAKVASIPFAHARLGPFFQEEPKLINQFSHDAFLQGFLQRHVPSKVFFFLKLIEKKKTMAKTKIGTCLFSPFFQIIFFKQRNVCCR